MFKKFENENIGTILLNLVRSSSFEYKLAEKHFNELAGKIEQK